MSYLLRLENGVIFCTLIIIYILQGYSWALFFILFLIPDLALFGYLINSYVGTILYNLTHSYIGAVICTLIGYLFFPEYLFVIGLIWLCHISFDRTLGYGLKYYTGFSYTHLGKIGRKSNV